MMMNGEPLNTRQTEALTRILTTCQAAYLLGRSPVTLKAWRRRGIGPRFVRFGGTGPTARVGYRMQDLVAFLDASAVDPAGGGKEAGA